MSKIPVPEDTPYRPGTLPPQGYLQWHEWAAVQANAGLVQMRCKKCKKYFFPQEYENHFTVDCPYIEENDA